MRVELLRAAPSATFALLLAIWGVGTLVQRKIESDRRLHPVVYPQPFPVHAVPPVSPLLPSAAPFEQAVSNGDLAEMQRQWKRNLILNGILARAARTGRRDIVKWLFDHDAADAGEGQSLPTAPILEADAFPDVIEELFAHGVPETTITMAAQAGKPNAVTRVLAKDHPSKELLAASLVLLLHPGLGTAHDRRTIFFQLLAAGADVNLSDSDDGSTNPMMEGAVSACHTQSEALDAPDSCLPIVRELVRRKAIVDGASLIQALTLPESERMPVLDALLGGRLARGATAVALTRASGDRDASLIPKFARRGIRWTSDNDEDTPADSPLLRACEQNDDALIRAFLVAGAPVNLQFAGATPLRAAIDGNDSSSDTVKLLLSFRANPNMADADGMTPLMMAVNARDSDTVALLLNAGAYVNATIASQDGATALDLADDKHDVEIIELLKKRGGKRLRVTRTHSMEIGDPDCTTPYWYDAQGVKHYKPSCLGK